MKTLFVLSLLTVMFIAPVSLFVFGSGLVNVLLHLRDVQQEAEVITWVCPALKLKAIPRPSRETHILLNNVAYKYFIMGKHKAWTDLEKCIKDIEKDYGIDGCKVLSFPNYLKSRCYVQDQPWWIPMEEFLKEKKP